MSQNRTPKRGIDLSWLLYIPPFSIILLGIGIILIFKPHGDNVNISSDTLIGLIAIIIAVLLAFGSAWKFKRDLDTLRKESIDPLHDSLTRGHKSQLHEKMAMMQIYLNTDFRLETNKWQIERALEDVMAAFEVREVSTEEIKRNWITTIGLLIKKFEDEIPLETKRIGQFKYYHDNWNEAKKDQ